MSHKVDKMTLWISTKEKKKIEVVWIVQLVNYTKVNFTTPMA